MLRHKVFYAIDFFSVETIAILKPHRVEPEFGFLVVLFNVNMRRFILISSIKEEAVGTNSQDGGHSLVCLARSIVVFLVYSRHP